MSECPQLDPLFVEEQRLNSKPLSGDPARHPDPKGDHAKPPYGGNSCLNPRFCLFGHYPKRMTIVVVGNLN